MHRLLVLILLVLVPASFTSCRHGRTGKQGEPGQNGIGQDGQDGQDGNDGLDGSDGLNGIGFDYVRSMDGAVVCNSALIVPVNLIVPANILALAPGDGQHHLEGLTLTFGTLDSPIRVYLGKVRAGEYCVLEKMRHNDDDDDDDDDDRGTWTPVGEQLIFTEDGYVAVVPPEFYNFVNPSVFTDTLLSLFVVEFSGECNELNYSSRYLKIGKDIRINFNRD